VVSHLPGFFMQHEALIGRMLGVLLIAFGIRLLFL
jgi:hypothetical protein